MRLLAYSVSTIRNNTDTEEHNHALDKDTRSPDGNHGGGCADRMRGPDDKLGYARTEQRLHRRIDDALRRLGHSYG